MRVRTKLAALDTNSSDNGRSRPVIALIDPGSDRSIVQLNQLPSYIQNKLRKFQTRPSAPNPLNIRLHKDLRICTITNEIVQDCISLVLNVQLDNWSGECQFLVVKSLKAEQAILGARTDR